MPVTIQILGGEWNNLIPGFVDLGLKVHCIGVVSSDLK